MKGRLFLIHWDLEEADELTLALRSHGWQVEYEHESLGRAEGTIMVHPPDRIVIYLTRKPARGLKLARRLRNNLWAQDIPILFVGGRHTAKITLPDVTFTSEKELMGTLDAGG